jgi:chromate transporter
MKKLFDLFFAFAKLGAMTFGGGLTMLPLLEREIVEKRGWATEEEMLDYYAIGQCTPGIIAVNTATFIGYKQAGALGGIFATAGMVFPSLVIITVLAAFLSNFADIPAVVKAFAGIRICVCALMTNVIIRLFKTCVIDAWTMALYIGVFALSLLLGISPIVFVLLAAAVGISVKTLCAKKELEDEQR